MVFICCEFGFCSLFFGSILYIYIFIYLLVLRNVLGFYKILVNGNSEMLGNRWGIIVINNL